MPTLVVEISLVCLYAYPVEYVMDVPIDMHW